MSVELTIKRLGVKAELYLKKNAPTILTCVGAVGVVATTVAAVKATPKAIDILKREKEEKGEELTKLEVAKYAAPVYIPTMLLGAGTIACIFGANMLNKQKQASLMSAYALLDRSYKDYRNKVEEMYGDGTNSEIRGELAKDKYDKDDIIDEDEDDGKILFYDEFSQRYYRATSETVLRAEYEINKQLSDYGSAYLNDYYDLLGIDRVDYGDHLGWSSAQMYETFWDSWLHFHKTKVVMDDGLECWIINFTEPFVNFADY